MKFEDAIPTPEYQKQYLPAETWPEFNSTPCGSESTESARSTSKFRQSLKIPDPVMNQSQMRVNPAERLGQAPANTLDFSDTQTPQATAVVTPTGTKLILIHIAIHVLIYCFELRDCLVVKTPQQCPAYSKTMQRAEDKISS